MRVLAVSFMLPPMLYPQAIQIGRLLEGCDIDLVTVSGRFAQVASGPQGKDFSSGQRFIHRMEFPHQSALSGIWHRVAMRLLPFYGRSPDEFLPWAKHSADAVATWLKDNRHQVDVLATFGEPMSDHLIGLSLKKQFGIPWLAHFSDPWADNPFRSFQPLANWRNRKLEAEVIEKADSVVFTSEETKKLVMRKYPEAWMAKTFVLPHSFDVAEFENIRNTSQRADTLTIRYLGNFYGHRTPFPLLKALARMCQQSPEVLDGVCIEIVGGVPKWMRLHPALRRIPKQLLRFCPPVPYHRSLELMAASDLLMVIDAPAKESVFLPSKLVDYIGTQRPIFGIVPPGASKRLIERLGGLTADPLDSDAIESQLMRAIADARATRRAGMGWGDPAVRREFELESVAQQFRRMLNETKLGSCT